MAIMNENGRFSSKVAFVTGAGSGIGRATAIAFALEGARVVVADVTEDANRETARMIADRGGRALAVTCDVTRAEDVRRVIGIAGQGAYCAAKWGLIGLTKGAALDYAGRNLRVNAVCPGYVDTAMMERFTGGTEEGRQQNSCFGSAPR